MIQFPYIPPIPPRGRKGSEKDDNHATSRFASPDNIFALLAEMLLTFHICRIFIIDLSITQPLASLKISNVCRNIFVANIISPSYCLEYAILSSSVRPLRDRNYGPPPFLMPCCIGCSEINKINRHLICPPAPHLRKKDLSRKRL